MTAGSDARGEWLPIALAPMGRDLEISVIDREGVHSVVFPCRKSALGWVNSASGGLVEVHPTHWRVWGAGA